MIVNTNAASNQISEISVKGTLIEEPIDRLLRVYSLGVTTIASEFDWEGYIIVA
jgi:hypothetical protein